MYVPSAFAETRPQVLRDFIRRHDFATIVTSGSDGPVASHVPVILRGGGPGDPAGGFGSMQLHLARQNDHSRQLAAGETVLAIFHGPHAYISPTWYATPVAVPTWNYIVAHAYGTPRELGDAELDAHLRELVAAYESKRPGGWDVDRLPADAFEKLKRSIVGFDVPIARLEGKWKLNQNRTADDRRGAIAGLREAGDAASLTVADWMAAALDAAGDRAGGA